MEKKTYMKPETETMRMDLCQPVAQSDPNTIYKSDNPDDLEADGDGYFWAE